MTTENILDRFPIYDFFEENPELADDYEEINEKLVELIDATYTEEMAKERSAKGLHVWYRLDEKGEVLSTVMEEWGSRMNAGSIEAKGKMTLENCFEWIKALSDEDSE